MNDNPPPHLREAQVQDRVRYRVVKDPGGAGAPPLLLHVSEGPFGVPTRLQHVQEEQRDRPVGSVQEVVVHED